jgi:hypothetical protein
VKTINYMVAVCLFAFLVSFHVYFAVSSLVEAVAQGPTQGGNLVAMSQVSFASYLNAT